ncbi:hypothetical protein NW755_013061 [Fusarium falciforme]|uniref:Uncharacterized protein n=1 Tax=Fusarium falciforme TaxID=195108 RepID=A0A9W8QTF4_9HYPO|nr:hypothetical protein NW755_013061 [Fusarium falciforme]KAJ4238503.1 hypothetical protein NW757_012971 [Fusarium falciforme]
MGSDWDFNIDSDDVKELVESWKVGNDDDDSIESGDGGKDIEIKWKVRKGSEGTYVELQFKDSDIKDNSFKFTAFGGVISISILRLIA